MKLKFLIFLFLIAFQFRISAQENDVAFNKVLNMRAMGDYSGYLKNLDQYIEKNPNAKHAYLTRIKEYIIARKWEEAYYDIGILKTLDSKFNYPLQQLYEAEVSFYLGDYAQAQQSAQAFLEIPKMSKENQVLMKAMLRNAKFIQNNTKKYQPIKLIEHPKLNSKDNEYFPSLTADNQTIYFTRNIRGNEDIFYSVILNNEWQSPIPVDEEVFDGKIYTSINSYSANEGAHTIAPSGKFLFFTACDRVGGAGSCDLYMARREGQSFKPPKILPSSVNTKKWESQPCLNSEGNLLFYCNNHSGNIDIVRSQINEAGDFSIAESISPLINTEFSEEKPFLHPDGKTLYFASNGHPGYGGFDLFMSKWNGTSWGEPINLGPYINTPNDDRSIFITADGKSAWIAREKMQNGQLNLDIYEFTLPEEFKPEKVVSIKGIVKEKNTQKPITTKIKIDDLDNTATSQNIISDKVNGTFMTTLVADRAYSFYTQTKGYAIFSKSIFLEKSKDNLPIEVEIELVKLEKGTKFDLNNVYFETNKFDIMPKSYGELDALANLLSENASLKIQVIGHTDNIGNAQSNLTLSDKRASAVKGYLISKGIDTSRIISIGKGAQQPKASNDSENGRALNRRTEIEIL
ncbi:MAG: OmpA family protein [Chitinophagales bacterium]|nr:OmpA family protein [Chitinophagales bacterium]